MSSTKDISEQLAQVSVSEVKAKLATTTTTASDDSKNGSDTTAVASRVKEEMKDKASKSVTAYEFWQDTYCFESTGNVIKVVIAEQTDNASDTAGIGIGTQDRVDATVYLDSTIFHPQVRRSLASYRQKHRSNTCEHT